MADKAEGTEPTHNPQGGGAGRPERFECSVASRERSDSMVGTGSQVRGWLAIEVPGAWGRKALVDSALGEHVPPDFEQRMGRVGLRAVCIRARHRDRYPGEGLKLYTCRVSPMNQPPGSLWQATIGDLAEVPALAEALASTEPAPDDGSPGPGWERADRPVFLICTNGRHDQCCAVWGRPIIRGLADGPWRNQVWESSHVGGDRFAPNLVALPHSWYFGRFENADLDRLLTDITERRIDLGYFRGRTSLSFADQAVEHEVRRQFDLTGDGDVTFLDRSGSTVTVEAAGRTVTATFTRHLIVSPEPLTCDGRPGQRHPEFTVELTDLHAPSKVNQSGQK